ncbi:Protein of unknown function [Bacillus cereus]|nr:Protein of unknown function [Bacillus cereus]
MVTRCVGGVDVAPVSKGLHAFGNVTIMKENIDMI